MPRARLAACVVATTALLTGCFTTAADYKRDAEKFIASDVGDYVGVEFASVECEEPRTQDVGEHFACSAIDVDGGEWEFDVVITSKNHFEVNEDRRPDEATT